MEESTAKFASGASFHTLSPAPINLVGAVAADVAFGYHPERGVRTVPQLRSHPQRRPVMLTATTPDDHSIVFTRNFTAPQARVFAAMTSDDLRHWLTGPPGWTMTTCEPPTAAGMDYRYQWSGAAGEVLTLSGRCSRYEAPRLVAQTERMTMNDLPLGEYDAVLELAEADGGTAMTLSLSYATKAMRDGALGSGMEQGMAANYDKLDEYLTKSNN